MTPSSAAPQEFVADFHIHSKYSRATSPALDIPELTKWAKLKGVGLLGTGDFTHPLWFQELSERLRPTGPGLYTHDGQPFILTTEVNTLFYKQGRAKNVHHVLLAPSLSTVERINHALAEFGDLSSDGRPLLSMEAWRLAEVVLGVDPRCLIVPAHAWTPHFAIFGSNSGFDTVEECFEHQTENIHVLETGLSSDPAMNWRLSKLDRYTLISNSDSHSARRIGREANLFRCALDYDEIVGALKAKDRAKFVGTIEFFPEEGKYHLDGHRNCHVRLTPEETKRLGGLCPKCGRRVTVGVLHRVDRLADRPDGFVPPNAIPFRNMVPLDEIISEAIGVGVGSQAVDREYFNLVNGIGTELEILFKTPEETLRRATQPRIVEGILRVRNRQVAIEAGYDGEYGKVHVFGDHAAASVGEQQMTLF